MVKKTQTCILVAVITLFLSGCEAKGSMPERTAEEIAFAEYLLDVEFPENVNITAFEVTESNDAKILSAGPEESLVWDEDINYWYAPEEARREAKQYICNYIDIWVSANTKDVDIMIAAYLDSPLATSFYDCADDKELGFNAKDIAAIYELTDTAKKEIQLDNGDTSVMYTLRYKTIIVMNPRFGKTRVYMTTYYTDKDKEEFLDSYQ